MVESTLVCDHFDLAATKPVAELLPPGYRFHTDQARLEAVNDALGLPAGNVSGRIGLLHNAPVTRDTELVPVAGRTSKATETESDNRRPLSIPLQATNIPCEYLSDRNLTRSLALGLLRENYGRVQRRLSRVGWGLLAATGLLLVAGNAAESQTAETGAGLTALAALVSVIAKSKVRQPAVARQVLGMPPPVQVVPRRHGTD